jgi:hypothetical protein
MRHIDILMISEGLDYVTEEARSAFLRLWFDISSAHELGRELIEDLDLWRFAPTPSGQESSSPRCSSMRCTRRSSCLSNSLSVGTPRLEATVSRSRARSSVVIPGDASATSDRSPAVLVGRRTTSESVPSSPSRKSSSAVQLGRHSMHRSVRHPARRGADDIAIEDR